MADLPTIPLRPSLGKFSFTFNIILALASRYAASDGIRFMA
jgi:hypothetical protein